MSSLNDSPILLRVATTVSPLLSFGAMVFLAAVAMRWLPARPPKFYEALIGGCVSAMLLVGLKIGLAQFLKHTDVGSFYGSALTLVLVLFWIYFAMQAFLFGAELAAELALERRMGEPVEPEIPILIEDTSAPIEAEPVTESETKTEEIEAVIDEVSIAKGEDSL